MTSLEKTAYLILFDGGNVVGRGEKFGVRDKENRLIGIIYPKVFNRMKEFLKLTPNGWVLSKKKVLELRGNTWIKKQYKEIRNNKKQTNGKIFN
jgi:hypothetical protein